jgi:hypothetical protein
MFRHNHSFKVVSLNIQLSQRAVNYLFEGGADVILVQEVPWTPWKVHVKDTDKTHLENIMVFNSQYEPFHAPLSSGFRIRTAI